MYSLEVKKSKFISYGLKVDSKQSVKEVIAELKQKHTGATHICYAYIINNGASGGMSDDGEPAGTAGKPLFKLLNLKKKTDYGIFVVRYYGGKKLGAGLLLRTYVRAGKFVI